MNNHSPKKVAGMNVGSATLVMLFSVICLTIFAVLSVVTAGNALTLAEKSADAVTDYYQAECLAIEILNDMSADYNGTYVLPTTCTAQLDESESGTRLSYWVPIDDSQELWVQVYDQNGTLAVSHWEVQYCGAWVTDQSLNVWGG